MTVTKDWVRQSHSWCMHLECNIETPSFAAQHIGCKQKFPELYC